MNWEMNIVGQYKIITEDSDFFIGHRLTRKYLMSVYNKHGIFGTEKPTHMTKMFFCKDKQYGEELYFEN